MSTAGTLEERWQYLRRLAGDELALAMVRFNLDLWQDVPELEDQVTIEELKRRIAVQQAFLDGKTVQYKSVLSAGWRDYQAGPDDFPSFDWVYCDWRIKPEPRVIYVPEYKNGQLGPHWSEPHGWSDVVRWHRFVEDTSYGEEK